MAPKTFRIDALPDSAHRYRDYDAVVCIDVLLAGSTAVTAAAQGRRTYLAASRDEALARAHGLERPLCAVEFGEAASRFEVAGPAALLAKPDHARPFVLVSDTARLLSNAAGAALVYVACLRNLEATARHLDRCHKRVAILGAGDADQLSCEDQMAAVWLGALLEQRGFAADDRSTAFEMERWRNADPALIGWGRSAERLRESGRQRDLELVLNAIEDLDRIFGYSGGEVRPVATGMHSVASALGQAWGATA
jgi:2-phosphosulfolactate phosphatase